jgi:hypothetical protein
MDSLSDISAEELEDDSATIFDSAAAYELEWRRCRLVYEPPPSIPRGWVLKRAESHPMFWALKLPAAIRTAWQFGKDFVPTIEAVALMSKHVVSAYDAIVNANGYHRQMFNAAGSMEEGALQDDTCELLSLLTTLSRDLASATRLTAKIEKFIATSAPILRQLSPVQLEYGRSCDGFARFVFRYWDSDIHLARALVSKGMSRLWTDVGIATRMKPVPRDMAAAARGRVGPGRLVPAVGRGFDGGRRDRGTYRSQQASWRQSARRAFKLVFHRPPPSPRWEEDLASLLRERAARERERSPNVVR